MKVNQSTQQRLKEINQAGTVATKTKIVMNGVEKDAKESAKILSRPSTFVQKVATAFNKLNIF